MSLKFHSSFRYGTLLQIALKKSNAIRKTYCYVLEKDVIVPSVSWHYSLYKVINDRSQTRRRTWYSDFCYPQTCTKLGRYFYLLKTREQSLTYQGMNTGLKFIRLLTTVWYRKIKLFFLSSEESWRTWMFQIKEATNEIIHKFHRETIIKKELS